jgi:hypothetical protein
MTDTATSEHWKCPNSYTPPRGTEQPSHSRRVRFSRRTLRHLTDGWIHLPPDGAVPRRRCLRAIAFRDGCAYQVSETMNQVVNAMLWPNPDNRPCAALIAVTIRWTIDNLSF